MKALPDEVELDEHGYPTDAWLQQITDADDYDAFGVWLVETFPNIVNVIGYGTCRVYNGVNDWGRPMHVIQYSTGGWSGQESLINTIESTMLGIMYLHSWRRGGHYEFRVEAHTP